jgi:hypothetical protein
VGKELIGAGRWSVHACKSQWGCNYLCAYSAPIQRLFRLLFIAIVVIFLGVGGGAGFRVEDRRKGRMWGPVDRGRPALGCSAKWGRFRHPNRAEVEPTGEFVLERPCPESQTAQ